MAFRHYTPLTVDHTKVPSAQSNFPVLISITDPRFKTVGNGGHVQNSSGFDIRPYSDAGLTSALTFQLDFYSATTGQVVMWVLESSLSSTVDTLIYLAYGDPSLTTDGSSTGTWTNSFKAVYHLSDGTTLNLSDKSGNGYNLTNTNSVVAAAGQIDGAAKFVTASNQSLNAVSTGTIDPGNAFTLSVWVDGTTSFPNTYNTAVAMQNGGAYKIIYVTSGGSVAMYMLAGGAVVSYDPGSHVLTTNHWHLLHLTYDTTNGLKGYVDGAQDGTAAANGNPNATESLYIGNQTLNAGLHWDGLLDEVRVASAARSANWITTEWNNQNSPGTFMSMGAEVSVPVVMNTATGAFAVTGNPAQLLSRRLANTAAGIFSETGNASQLLARRLLNSASGLFMETGTNVAMFKFSVPHSRLAVINFQNPAEHQISSNLLGTLTSTGLKIQEGQSQWPR